jgi:hypothetical protein
VFPKLFVVRKLKEMIGTVRHQGLVAEADVAELQRRGTMPELPPFEANVAIRLCTKAKPRSFTDVRSMRALSRSRDLEADIEFET